jgi:hypothetical protein
MVEPPPVAQLEDHGTVPVIDLTGLFRGLVLGLSMPDCLIRS